MARDDVDSGGDPRRRSVVGSSRGRGLRFSVAPAAGEGHDGGAVSPGEAAPGGRPEPRRPPGCDRSSQDRAGGEEGAEAGQTQTDHAAFSQRIGL